MYKSGVVHEPNMPSDKETALAILDTIKTNSGLFEDTTKVYEAKCRQGNRHDDCNWQEVTAPTIRDTKSGSLIQSFNSTCGMLPQNKKRLRNFISKCSTCSKTRYGSEII